MTDTDELTKRIDQIKAEIAKRPLSETERMLIARRLDDLWEMLQPRKHQITELKGLGKEFWRSIDVDEYIRKERDSWR